MSKEYTTDNIYIDGYLSDGSGSGTSGQVLSSTGGGVSWVDGSGTIIGGPYLPLAGGTLTGDLTISKAATPLFTLLDTTNNISLLIGADDANTFIRSSSTANLYLQPGGSTSVTLLSGGNVGIGNTNPSRPLDVTADSGGVALKLRGRPGNDYSFLSFTQNDGSGTAWAELAGVGTSGGLRIDTAGSERMRIDSAGNVGIGTTAPGSKLEVTGDITKIVSISQTRTDTSTSLATMRSFYTLGITQFRGGVTRGLYMSNVTDNLPGIQVVDSSDNSGPLSIQPFGGNVGIGTTSPGSKLEIKTSGTNSVLELDNSDTNYTLTQFNSQGVLKGFSGFNTSFMLFGGEAGVTTRLVSGGQYAATILTNGNFGIGTTSPAGKLHVNAGTNRNLRITNGVQSTTGIDIQSLNDAANANMPLTLSGSLIAMMEGNVGIGTTNPETNLMIYDTVDEDPAEPGYATTGMFSLNTSGQATLSMGVGSNNAFWMSNVNRAFTGPNYYNILLNPLGGRVGIGTSSPATTLEVKTGTSAGTVRLSSDGNGAIFSANGDLQFYTNNTAYATKFYSANKASTLATILDSGKVLVGVTGNQTQSKLTSRQDGSAIEFGHLNQSGQYYGTLGAMSSSGSPFIAFSADNSTSNSFTTKGAKGFVISQDTGLSGDLIFSSVPLVNTANQSLVEKMRIDSAGAIKFNAYGAGTLVTDASGNITASSGGGAGGPYLPLAGGTVSGTAGTGASLVTIENTSGSTATSYGLLVKGGGNSSSGKTFEVQDSSGNSDFIIKGNGNVGIGTTTFGNFSTAKELIIKGDAVNTNAVLQTISNDGGSSLAIYAGGSSTDDPAIIYQNDLRFGSATDVGLGGYAERMRIDSSGNVGIGTTAFNNYWSGYAVLKLGADNGFFSNIASGTGSALFIAQNVYNDGNIYRHVRSNESGLVDMRDGKFSFLTSPSGSAGQAATMTNRFTILQGGNVGIGTASPSKQFAVRSLNNSATTFAGFYALNESQGLEIGYAGIYSGGTSANVDMNIQAKGTGNILINGSGNVGIGTTSPSYKLEVNGGTTLVGGGFHVSTDQTIITSSSYTFRDGVYINNPNSSSAAASSTTVMSIGAMTSGTSLITTGNVGIGTTSPSNKLSLAGSGQNWASSPAIKMWDSYNSKGWYVGSANNASTGDFYIRSVTAESAPPVAANQEFTIKQSGNVGIGTISPADKLDIKASNSQLRLTDADDSTFTQFSSSGGKLAIRQDSTSDSHFWLTSAGNVGIGTSSPSNPLEISSDTSTSLVYQRTGVSANKWGFHSDNDATYWQNVTSGSLLFTLQNGGNVGIGTTSPAAKLDVQSSVTGNLVSRVYNPNTGTSSSATFRIASAANNANSARLEFSDSAYYTATISGDRAQGLVFRTSATGTNPTTIPERMRITSGGNVGIGTTAPRADSFTRGLTIGNNTDGAAQLVLQENTLAGGWRIFNNGYLGFIANNNEAMRIESDATVYVKGQNSGVDGTIRIGERAFIEHRDGGQTITSIISNYNSNTAKINFKMKGVSDANAQMTILGGGNVGIGTTTPSTKLQVNGRIKADEGVQVGNETSTTASLALVGTLRYRGAIASGLSTVSVVEMCMQTGSSTFAWKVIYTTPAW